MESNHQRARDLFFEALDLPDDADENAWLDEKCGDDSELKTRVSELLNSTVEDENFMPEAGALQDAEAVGMVREAVSAANEDRKPVGEGRHDVPNVEWTPPPPEVVDGLLEAYEVYEIVGHGGMGTVYRGMQISLERQVAIKILPPEYGDDPAFAARFRREALSMAKMDHPNIVTIHDFGSVQQSSSERLFYIVMEFVEGADLQRLISSRKMGEKAAIGVVGQICDALQYAHKHGFVHRDIKPANIFVSTDGTVKVGDFGLAKLCDSPEIDHNITQMTIPGAYLGTPNYMAPETHALGGDVDHRADIYSLGVMLYQMLTGSIPQGIFKPPSQKVRVDTRLDEIVIKAMQEEPDHRFQQASEIKSAVTEITNVDPVPDVLRPGAKKRRRRFWEFWKS